MLTEKIYKSYQELEKDIGEQSGEYVFEIKQKEIESLKKEFESTREALRQIETVRGGLRSYMLIAELGECIHLIEHQYRVKSEDLGMAIDGAVATLMDILKKEISLMENSGALESEK